MSFPEPIRILSDLHLAHPASRVQNVWQIEPLIEGARTVVFNGDTAELRLHKARETAKRYIDSLRSLCRDRGVQAVFINGNHDPDLSNLNDLELLGGRVLVTHGDVLFPDVTPWGREAAQLGQNQALALAELAGEAPPQWEHLLAAAKEASLRTGSGNGKMPSTMREWVAAVCSETGHPLRTAQVLRAWAIAPGRAARLAARHRPRARWVIMGHTHMPGHWLRDDRVVLNTGAYLPWLGRRVVEVANGEILMRRVRADGKYFRTGAEVYRATVPAADFGPPVAEAAGTGPVADAR